MGRFEVGIRIIMNYYDSLLSSEYDGIYDTRFVALRERKILEYYIKNLT